MSGEFVVRGHKRGNVGLEAGETSIGFLAWEICESHWYNSAFCIFRCGLAGQWSVHLRVVGKNVVSTTLGKAAAS